jgi:hypothetical protein
MRRNTPVALAVVLNALFLVASGCGSGEGKKPLPGALNRIEGQAEDIIDIVPNNRWDNIRSDVRAIETDWSQYKKQATADGASAAVIARFDDALHDLTIAAGGARGPETSQAANDVSGATVDLFGLYDVGRPVAIGRLDVLGRQVILDVQRGDINAAGAQVRKLERVWRDGLRADVLDHKGGTVAGRTDTTLNAIERAATRDDARTVVAQTRGLLELVDDMERLY